jgi:beta-glucosidase
VVTPSIVLAVSAAGSFPEHFLFGAATAAHQIEGGNVNSDWWAFEHEPGTRVREPSGDACDSWHRFEEDLTLCASIGLNAYRFSVEWARVEPEPGHFSTAALDHYRRVVEGCRTRGLVPVVTLHHFTLPRWMAERGGFESEDAPTRLAEYAARVGGALGDAIGLACTINEPSVVAMMGYLRGHFPPGVRDRGRFEAVSATLRAAHHAMVEALRAGPGSFPVGITLSMSEMEAAEGGEARLAQALEHLEDAYLRDLRGDDFVGVQTYTRTQFGPDGPLAPPEGARRTKMGYEFRPQAVEHTVRRAAHVTGLPVVVTETGLSTDDDAERIEFIDAVVSGLAACVGDGLDVRGLFYWTLLDNFEWALGYSQPFGLAACDRWSFARTPRPSAAHLGAIASTARRAPRVVDAGR